MSEKFLNVAQCAEHVGLTEEEMTDLATGDYGFPVYRLAGRLRFKQDEVNAWLAGQRHAPQVVEIRPTAPVAPPTTTEETLRTQAKPAQVINDPSLGLAPISLSKPLVDRGDLPQRPKTSTAEFGDDRGLPPPDRIYTRPTGLGAPDPTIGMAPHELGGNGIP